ncbi:hypothetical protein Zmor_015473 [Zophobas morio]|uniref:Uncharacterized protein n=1 Tax=Zophobas morio TaxID=2755281 RepID=A0AA38MH81_9CUCU|nr:hypothetical protein Zmor_015473 [Zophobas morio]
MLPYNYVLDQKVLQRPDYVCDLGVTYDAKLSFHKHYEVISTSAHKSLGFVVRNAAEFKDLDVLRPLFSHTSGIRLGVCVGGMEPFTSNLHFSVGKNAASILKVPVLYL